MTTTYTEAAAADGTWTRTLDLPDVALSRVMDQLAEFTRKTGQPICAFAFTVDDNPDGPVDELMLYRDPSVTHGTPTVEECDTAADQLIAATGWEDITTYPIGDTIVVLGLREGYDQDAVEHQPEELDLGDDVPWRVGRLMSARLVDGDVRWYDERAVLAHPAAWMLPDIAVVAAQLGQHRFSVTDYVHKRTYAVRNQKGE